jgi:adenylosuccinate lyase
MSQYETYLSPFSWRYGSKEMRQLWGEAAKRRLWRHIWVALARTQSELGLVKMEQVAELEAHADDVNIERSLEIEAELHHDLMAEVRAFAEVCPTAGGIIHLGATSMDIEDNADALRLRQALDLLLKQIDGLLNDFAAQIKTYAATPVMAFTHLQPAEPTTLGYRLASYAQDLLLDREEILRCRTLLKGKGFKGAVGTAASYIELLGADGYAQFETRLSQVLDLPFFPVSTQTYPRKQDYSLLSALSGLGATLYKFAFDLRLLQSPVIGEWGEPFGRKQVGSSAMPFKRNPINSEKIDSLARSLAGMPQIAWHNAAHSLLERTLDDSANRRTLLPEAFLTCDEIVRTARRLVAGLNVNKEMIARNMAVYAPFASTERLLMALVKAGADRQEMHEHLRDHAMRAWEAVRQGLVNPLAANIASDPIFHRYLQPDAIQALLRIEGYTGIACDRALWTAESILQAVTTV